MKETVQTCKFRLQSCRGSAGNSSNKRRPLLCTTLWTHMQGSCLTEFARITLPASATTAVLWRAKPDALTPHLNKIDNASFFAPPACPP